MDNTKILYSILSGSDFKDSRNVWIRDTWVKNIDSCDDYVFLQGDSDVNREDVIGFGTPEGHDTAYLKLKEFHKFVFNNIEKYSEYDWFMFSDTDCYVYPKVLKPFLSKYKIDSPLCATKVNIFTKRDSQVGVAAKTGGKDLGTTINKKITAYFRDDYHIENCSFYAISGGGGWAFNREAMKVIGEYMFKNDMGCTSHYDIPISLVVQDCNIPHLNCDQFMSGKDTDNHKHGEYSEKNKCFTNHFILKDDFYRIFEVEK